VKLENFIKKITIAEYDALPALRSTSLKQFIQSPRHFKYAQSDEAREANNGKSHFVLGRLVHAALLEPATVRDEFMVVEAGTRNAKAYTEAVKLHPDKGIVLAHELAQANQMVAAINELPQIRDIIEGSEPEVSAAAMISGVFCKCRTDLLGKKDNHIYDLKTTSESAKNFPFVMGKFGYDVSSAFYIDILLANNLDVSGYTFIVAEKEPPYGVMLYEVTAEYLEYGRSKYLPALEKYKECLKTGVYPSYDLTPVQLVPPNFKGNK